MPETKVCSKCGRELPATQEYFRKRSDGGKGERLRGVCKECQCKRERELNDTEYRKEYRKNYYEEHHEEILDKKAVYYQEHKEEICYKQQVLKREQTLAAKRTYHLKNKDKEKEYSKEYRSRPEVIEREKQRRIDEAEKNKEYQRQYLQTDRGRTLSRIKIAKRRALREKTIVTFTLEQWEESKEFFNHECAYCGNKSEVFDKDHVVPLSKGGTHTMQNIVPACEWCNGSKHNKDMETWYRIQPFFSETRLKKIYKYTDLKPGSEIQQISMF